MFAHYKDMRNVPELRLVNRYHDDDGYIEALCDTVQAHWDNHGRGEKLVMSFHGVPERTLMLGDPYHCECQKTARLLAGRLAVAERLCRHLPVTLRQGRWLQPYTEPTLQELARQACSAWTWSARVHQRLPGNAGRDLDGSEA